MVRRVYLCGLISKNQPIKNREGLNWEIKDPETELLEKMNQDRFSFSLDLLKRKPWGA